MLSLLLAAAFALPQDPPAPPAPPVVAAPETPEAVQRFLSTSQAQLYDTRRHGLKSLSFTAPLNFPAGPTMIELGAVDVAWSVGEAVAIEPRFGQLPPSLAAQIPSEALPSFRAAVGDAMHSLAEQLLSIALGDPFGPLMQTHAGSLGTTDGAVSVSFSAAPGSGSEGTSMTWLFDDDSVPVASLTDVQQETPMGVMTVTVRSEHNWRPHAGGELLLDTIKATRHIGGQSNLETTTVEYVEHDGLTLVSAIESRQLQMGQEVVNRIELKNVVVNGEPVTSAAAPAADDTSEG